MYLNANPGTINLGLFNAVPPDSDELIIPSWKAGTWNEIPKEHEFEVGATPNPATVSTRIPLLYF